MSVTLSRLISSSKTTSTANPGLVTELQNRLFTFSTLTDFSQVHDILELIHSHLKSARPSLKHIDQLQNDDVTAVAQALCEIANDKGSLQILAHHDAINDLLDHTAKSRQSELERNAPESKRNALLSLRNGGGTARAEHPFYRYWSDYFFGHISGLQDVATAIEKSKGPATQPTLSPLATFKVIADFLLLGSFITSSYQREPDRHIYDGLCHMVSLDIFNTARSRSVLIGSENLTELKRLQESGKSIVLIGNHRSYLDILAAMMVFRDLSPRIVAKDTLLFIPVLGWTPIHHPLQPSRWKQDALLSQHPLIDRKGGKDAVRKMNRDAQSAVAKGHALFAYPEGTRASTPNRSQEWGMRVFKDGIFHIMKELGDVVVAGLHCYGLGCLVPNSLQQDLLEGARLHQPIVLSVSKPKLLTANHIQERGVKNLNRDVWWDTWQQLAPLQALANSLLAA